MEEEDEQQPTWRPSQYLSTPLISEPGSGSGSGSGSGPVPVPVPGPMVSATLGRVMTALLNAKPKKLQDSISRLHSPPKIAAPVTASLEDSLWFLHKYIGDAMEKEEALDQVLIPMIEHSLRPRELKYGNQAMVLLNWLFQDEILFQDIVENYAGIISRKDDHYIALGWCMLGRSLIEYENTVKNIATDGITKKYNAMLKIFCSPLNHLLSIICYGSNLQEGYELPSRLSVAAADFILSLTVALTRKDMGSSDNRQKSSLRNAKNRPITLLSADTSETEANTLSKASELRSSLEMKLLLWDHLDQLMTLVQRLTAWSRKSRSLHARGLEKVFKWLLETKKHYDCFQNEADLEMVKTGALLVSSCWKHYGMLLHLEDNKFACQYKELLDQYLSGIQFYADNHAEEPSSNKDGGVDIIKFLLNCLSLLLGRLDDKKFGTAMTDFGSQLSQVLISQLSCADEEVIDGAICILKAVIFRTNHSLSESNLDDTRQMDAMLPSLLHLLDERDVASKAVVNLVAEYCSKCSDGWCMQEVLKRIDSKNVAQRRNAVDVVSDLIHISSGSVNVLSQETWQDIANHLLGCLRDEDCAIQNQASNLIPMIDPALVLPALVGLCYSAHEKVQLSASSTLIALLINHRQKPEVVCLLLDCLRNLCLNPDLAVSSAGNEEGSKVDADRLLKLLPEWAKTVEDWDVMVGPLIDKMISEPSNAVTVRFLSYISEYLAEASNLVFQRLILYTRGEKVVDESFSKWQGKTDASNDVMKWEHSLFRHLCPLLIIRLLPLRVFEDLSSPIVYGEHQRKCVVHERGYFSFEGTECVVELLINRALSKSEFEDVRKLAAELCGRIHPDVLIPIMSSQLEYAAQAKDVVMIKACLFSVCTSLIVRGINAYKHPDLFRIRRTIQNILLWSSVDGDEIAKAQHGCIDCLALMLCTELQAPESLRVSNLEDNCHVGNGNDCVAGDAAVQGSVLTYVIHQLTDNEKDFSCKSDSDDGTSEAKVYLSFRLCMANVLISACQKISGAGKIPFARKILPCVIHSARVMVEPETRVACIQILFSMVYHLKSLVSPYSSDLLGVALKSLREGSHEEKMAGAKLLASLMASDEEIVGSISGGLHEAKSLLRSLLLSDPSIDVRQICQQLLACLTF